VGHKNETLIFFDNSNIDLFSQFFALYTTMNCGIRTC